MNEYYKFRYNLSKFFLNIDNDTYNNYLNIIIPLLYIIPLLLILLLGFFSYKQSINISIIIYIIMLIILVILTFRLLFVLTSIQSSPILNSYKKYYSLANTIYKENFNSSYIKEQLKLKLLKNINNIENVYSDNASTLLNSSYDLLQYDEIDEQYTTKIYIDDFKKFKFLNKKMSGFITDIPDPYEPENTKYYIINLKILEEYYSDSIEKKLLLKYINDKYQTNFSVLYQPSIFTLNFTRNLNKLIKYFQYSI